MLLLLPIGVCGAPFDPSWILWRDGYQATQRSHSVWTTWHRYYSSVILVLYVSKCWHSRLHLMIGTQLIDILPGGWSNKVLLLSLALFFITVWFWNVGCDKLIFTHEVLLKMPSSGEARLAPQGTVPFLQCWNSGKLFLQQAQGCYLPGIFGGRLRSFTTLVPL